MDRNHGVRTMTTQIYTTEYLNNATSSRYYISDRDVADDLILPYTWHDIKIKPNDVVTTHTINGSVSKLYDNLLYIISQSMTPQSLIPSKAGYTTVLATQETGIDGLSAIQSFPINTVPTHSSANTKMNNMSTGLFIPTISGVDCGVLFIDDQVTPTMVVLRDDPTGGDMIALDSTQNIDNYTNRKFATNIETTTEQALGLGSPTGNWYPTSWFMDATMIFYNEAVAKNWIFVPDGRLGAQWLYVQPMEEGAAWVYSEALGWIWISEDIGYWMFHAVADNAGGSVGWLYVKEATNTEVATIWNDTDQKWYDVTWASPLKNKENTEVTDEAPVLEADKKVQPVFGTPTTKFDTFDNLLYMLNPGSNNIFKYDISGLTQHDNSYFDPKTGIAGKILLDIIGGKGSVDEPVKYNVLRTFSLDPSGNLYIVDTDKTNVYVKKYDVNTNHIATYHITADISSESPADLAFVKDRFYLLTNLAVHEFSTTFTHLRRWQLNDELNSSTGEVYRTITPSKENENVVYISTSEQVFKKFISKLDTGIGKFELTGRGMNIPAGSKIQFVSTVEHGDVEHVYVGDTEHKVVYKFVESSDYQRVLNTSFESRIVPLNDILIKSDEYVSNIVYNKTMAKLFYNHSLVSHSIVSKLVSEYAGTKSRKFKNLQYVLQEYIHSRSFGTKPKLGNFVGINEMLLCAVINRTLQKIYDFQIALVKDMETHVIDTPSYVDILQTAPVDVASLQPQDKYAYIDNKWTTEDKIEN